MKRLTATTPAARPAQAGRCAAVSARIGVFAPSGLLEQGPETARAFLPLRHPVLVARRLADIGRIPPGRLIFGVGIGGEDRREVSNCGVDPATRGRRMNECPAIVRRLLPEDVAEFLAPCAGARRTEFNLIPHSPDPGQAIAGTAAVKRLLAQQ
jgi:alkanesulfonate monooxygenase SsuD/methylene tetrahydromethanopterin reductase-like flavin-dependent oxidoreductase (luciferase family)